MSPPTTTREQDRLATPDEVAEHLKKSTKTLRNWRSRGEGPPYVGRGRGVRYPWSGVEAWVEANTVRPAA